MVHLLAASLVWAFSFGLIKHKLVGLGLDPGFVAFVRLAISFAVFAPFLKLGRLSVRLAVTLLAIGGVQYGLMYVFYLHSYVFLPAHMVAVFTIFTPLYVTCLNDVHTRQFHHVFLAAAVLAVAGAALIVYSGAGLAGMAKGFLVVQASNLCFALGQVSYRSLLGTKDAGCTGRGPASVLCRDIDVFALLYLGHSKYK